MVTFLFILFTILLFSVYYKRKEFRLFILGFYAFFLTALFFIHRFYFQAIEDIGPIFPKKKPNDIKKEEPCLECLELDDEIEQKKNDETEKECVDCTFKNYFIDLYLLEDKTSRKFLNFDFLMDESSFKKIDVLFFEKITNYKIYSKKELQKFDEKKIKKLVEKFQDLNDYRIPIYFKYLKLRNSYNSLILKKTSHLEFLQFEKEFLIEMENLF